MRYIYYCCLAAGLIFLAGSGEAKASGQTNFSSINGTAGSSLQLEAKPIGVTSYKTAAVYWLPDFLKDNLGMNTRVDEESKSGGGDAHGKRCAAYSGMTDSCPEPKVSDGYKTVFGGLKCYKNCHCPAKFQYTSENCKASEGKMVSGKVCEGKSEACVCQPGVTVSAGEKCDLYCGSTCVKKSCKPTISLGTGEQCLERCASGGACTAKGCKASQSVGAGEQCNERCASNSGICTAKSCKAGVSIGTGEQCTQYCASNSSVCTAKSCKAAVSVPNGYTCTETCASNSSVCTAKGCTSTSGYRSCQCGGSGGSVYSCGSTYYKSCNNCDPCPGYYSCGGSWQYCTGSTCYADSSRCSNYCASDYFPNSCSNSSWCNGVYRNGYCSGSCNPPAPAVSCPSGAANKGNQCDYYTESCHKFCCDAMSHPICNTYATPCSTLRSECTSKGGSFQFITNVACGGGYDGYSMYYCSAG